MVKNQIPKICLTCSKNYSVNYARKDGSKFCLFECYWKSKKGMAAWNKGKSNTWVIGDKNPGWKGGITTENNRIRSSLEYTLWRRGVFERDNYKCIMCNNNTNNLQADHIKPFAYYPELRLDINNGQTLCKECHSKTSSFGAKGRWNYKYEED